MNEGWETEQEGRYVMKEEKEGNMRIRDGRHKKVFQKRDIEKSMDGWLRKRCIGMEEEEKQGIGGCGTMERLDGGEER